MMPTYAYSNDEGQYEERFFRMGDAPREIVAENGAVLLRDFSAEHDPRRAGGGWPLECVASGVNAEQAGELRQFFASHGCPTEVSRDGNPIYRDPQHRKRALKLRGLHDRNSFY
jgi:hypothetical protein